MRDYRRVSASAIGGLQPNMQVTASLRLVRPLAVGGMGTVWIARHQGLQTDVVVKFILADLVEEPEVLARFQREAAAAADVKSPHVVQMFDYGLTDEGLPFIAMELLDGEDLDARIERERVLSPGEVAGIVLQVSRALTRAHEKKIVHRDIKPENIFLCETGDEDAFVKVLDFGIAKVSNPEQQYTLTGELVGSPLWMSPEQVMGLRSIDHRSDLWSLGVVAFYALTGKLPFGGMTIGVLSVAICSGELPVPSRVNPELSPAIDKWFATACAREAADRFQSARAMADALVAAVGGPTFARVRSRDAPSMGSLPTRLLSRPTLPPAPPIDTGPSLPPRRSGLSALSFRVAGAALLIVTAIGVGVFVLWRDPSPEQVTEPTEQATHATEPAPASSHSASASTPEPLEDAALPDASVAHPATKPRVQSKPKTKPTPVAPKSTKHAPGF